MNNELTKMEIFKNWCVMVLVWCPCCVALVLAYLWISLTLLGKIQVDPLAII